jgi:hypothetical protein
MHREKATSSQENLQLRFTLLHPNRISHKTTRRKRAAATTALKIGTNTVTLQHRRLMAMATSRTFTTLTIIALFVWLISHQPTVLFSQNESTTSNQAAVLFSQNKSAPATSHQPTEQALYFNSFMNQDACTRVTQSRHHDSLHEPSHPVSKTAKCLPP